MISPGFEDDNGEIRVSDELADSIVEKAKADIDYNNAAIDFIGFYQARGEDLPQAFKRFVLTRESDEYTAPKRKKGKKATSMFFRNCLIVLHVRQVIDILELNPYQNLYDKRGQSQKSVCACELVAEGFHKAGFQEVTMDTVTNTWKKRKISGLLDDIELLEQALQKRLLSETRTGWS